MILNLETPIQMNEAYSFDPRVMSERPQLAEQQRIHEAQGEIDRFITQNSLNTSHIEIIQGILSTAAFQVPLNTPSQPKSSINNIVSIVGE
jgi:hypothetical protein